MEMPYVPYASISVMIYTDIYLKIFIHINANYKSSIDKSYLMSSCFNEW